MCKSPFPDSVSKGSVLLPLDEVGKDYAQPSRGQLQC